MADDDIQFGEMEEQQPEECLRPDQNKHFAVVAYGNPGKGDLPVYVDLDVLLDMETHALSDTSVELGGVLLGGQHQDDEGRPFVVITDSLRARHYESTKGSFKFTHDTWEAISRERDQFPAELQMVGWYHTHPDWGVFLSGMDMFICNNFFNKRLDVAYVIDPCRDDRAFFMWNGDSSKGVRRTGGFYVTASRFRGAELAAVVGQVETDEASMRTVSQATGGAPQVIVTGPPLKPGWEGLAVIGMLTLQFCLLTLLAWRMLAPPEGDQKAELARLNQRLEAFERGGDSAEERRAANEMLGRVLQDLKGAGPGVVTQLEETLRANSVLKQSLEDVVAARKAAEKASSSASALQEKTAAELETKSAALAQSQAKVKELQQALEAHIQAAAAAAEGAKAGEATGIWGWVSSNGVWLFCGLLVAGLVVSGIYFVYRPPEPA